MDKKLKEVEAKDQVRSRIWTSLFLVIAHVSAGGKIRCLLIFDRQRRDLCKAYR